MITFAIGAAQWPEAETLQNKMLEKSAEIVQRKNTLYLQAVSQKGRIDRNAK